MTERFWTTIQSQPAHRIRCTAALVGTLVLLGPTPAASAHQADLRSHGPTSSLAGTSASSRDLRSQAATSSLAGTSGAQRTPAPQHPSVPANLTAKPSPEDSTRWAAIALGIPSTVIIGATAAALLRKRTRRSHATP